MLKIRHLLVGAAVVGAFASTAKAQDSSDHKPGGLNAVAHNVSKTAKKAGKDTKEAVKTAGGQTHQVLKKTGNGTKDVLKDATGVTSNAPDKNHKPGGLNKMARDVSHASKKTAHKVKSGVKNAKAEGHENATKTGKAVKDTIKP